MRADLKEMKIPDPASLMKWLGKDRALVTVGVAKDIAGNTDALQKVVRAWMKYV